MCGAGYEVVSRTFRYFRQVKTLTPEGAFAVGYQLVTPKGPEPVVQERRFRGADLRERVIALLEGATLHDAPYDPTDLSDLFLKFAAVPPTPDGVVAFATRYGLLGCFPDGAVPAPTPGEARKYGLDRPAEPLVRWVQEIKAMATVVAKWQRGRPSDDEAQELATLVSARLRELVSARVKWVDGSFEIDMDPSTLLGLMWWQFASRLGRKSEWRRCDREKCGKTFERGAGGTTGKKTHARYCSKECQRYAYYEKKRQSLRLMRSGASLSQVQKKTGLELARLRLWRKTLS